MNEQKINTGIAEHKNSAELDPANIRTPKQEAELDRIQTAGALATINRIHTETPQKFSVEGSKPDKPQQEPDITKIVIRS